MSENAENGKLSIAHLSAENFLMIEKLDYTPRAGVNIFAGKNRQGKTDMLRLVKAALKGADATIIKNGTDSAKLMVKLSDGHEIRRSLTLKSKRFQVRTPEGDIKASPQAYLDALLGDCDLSFDPVHFAMLSAKEQKQYILDTFNVGKVTPELLEKHLGDFGNLRAVLDFNQDGLSVLKNAESVLYTERASLNKAKGQKDALYEQKMASIEGFDPAAHEDRSSEVGQRIEDLKSALHEAQAAEKQAKSNASTRDTLAAKMARVRDELEEIPQGVIDSIPEMEKEANEVQAEISKLQARLHELNSKLEIARDGKKRQEAFREEIATLEETLLSITVPEVPDIKALTDELAEAHKEYSVVLAENEKAAVYKEAEDVKAEVEKLGEEARALTEKINILRGVLPSEIFNDEGLPFDLSFDGDHVVINGARVENMATSEQLELGLQIVQRRNKDAKLKLLCVDKIETLDDDSYKKFWEFCETEGYQAFATKVLAARMPEEAVVIEGGAIA